MTDLIRVHEGDPDRVVTLLPGRGYPHDAPLLHYTREVFTRHGWTARDVEWRDGSDTPFDAAAAQATAALDEVTASTQVVVAKSLGTLVMPYAVAHRLRGVWLTPVLVDPEIEAASQQLSPVDLLVGGTADALWDQEVARSAPARVFQVEGADHGMELPGTVLDSIDVVRAVAAQVEKFRELVDSRA